MPLSPVEITAGTHGLYSDLECQLCIGRIKAIPSGAGAGEHWSWATGEGFAKYQGRNDRRFYMKIGSDPSVYPNNIKYLYPSRDLPAETVTVGLSGHFLAMTMQTPEGAVTIGWVRWTAQSGPNGRDELEWFVDPTFRHGTSKRLDLSPSIVVTFNQPNGSLNEVTVHNIKEERLP